MDATASLARFTHDLQAGGDLPASTRDACARLALDTVGSALPAWDAPGVRELRALLAAMGQGPCRVWLAGERLPPPAATLVNSAMAHALEYDDLHCELPIHSPAWSSCRRCSRSPRRSGCQRRRCSPPRSSPAPRSSCRLARATAATVAMRAFAAGTRPRSSRASARLPPPAACSGSMPPASPARWACLMPRRAATSNASRTAAWSNGCSRGWSPKRACAPPGWRVPASAARSTRSRAGTVLRGLRGGRLRRRCARRGAGRALRDRAARLQALSHLRHGPSRGRCLARPGGRARALPRPTSKRSRCTARSSSSTWSAGPIGPATAPMSMRSSACPTASPRCCVRATCALPTFDPSTRSMPAGARSPIASRSCSTTPPRQVDGARRGAAARR